MNLYIGFLVLYLAIRLDVLAVNLYIGFLVLYLAIRLDVLAVIIMVVLVACIL